MNISTNLQTVDSITIGPIRDLNCDCWTRKFTFIVNGNNVEVTAFGDKKEDLQVKMTVKKETVEEVTR